MESHTIGLMRMGPPPGRERPRVQGAGPFAMFLTASMLFWPRLFIIGFWIFGSTLSKAFGSWVIPAAGFVLVPWTTIAYVFMWAISSHRVTGAEWVVVALGLLFDLVTWRGVARLRS